MPGKKASNYAGDMEWDSPQKEEDALGSGNHRIAPSRTLPFNGFVTVVRTNNKFSRTRSTSSSHYDQKVTPRPAEIFGI
ncbi:hypothetical protein PoB_006623200 [Plakobranchus ocellatus]|uniref:Uncharacterized protein n=1 Tax=Plakobranchus ocellatus TaxID=259542 RepID=A0AAV4D6I3_9GAST|nr:hypothetical protein PoB_006623200 [Plakobranchus ocellatus]